MKITGIFMSHYDGVKEQFKRKDQVSLDFIIINWEDTLGTRFGTSQDQNHRNIEVEKVVLISECAYQV